jgi:hypothetical protein
MLTATPYLGTHTPTMNEDKKAAKPELQIIA